MASKIKVSELNEILSSELSNDDRILITDISEVGSKRSKALTIGTLKSVCTDILESAVVSGDKLILKFSSGGQASVNLSGLSGSMSTGSLDGDFVKIIVSEGKISAKLDETFLDSLSKVKSISLNGTEMPPDDAGNVNLNIDGSSDMVNISEAASKLTTELSSGEVKNFYQLTDEDINGMNVYELTNTLKEVLKVLINKGASI